MFDHVALGVADVGRSGAFYDAVLAALGLRRLYETDGAVGYGSDRPRFWIGRPLEGSITAASPGGHVCFSADSKEVVEAFHAAGLQAGGTDAGGPGLRPQYRPNYYAAFLHDPDGHKIEAVCYLG